MRPFFISILFVFLSVSSLTYGQSKKLRAYLDTKQFFDPSIGNYLEIQLQFVGYSVNYISLNDGIQATVAVRIQLISSQKDTLNDIYLLNSPFFKDSLIDDFYDIRRLKVKPGKYELSLEIQDVNKMANLIKAKHTI